jgi:hypothetical protein
VAEPAFSFSDSPFALARIEGETIHFKMLKDLFGNFTYISSFQLVLKTPIMKEVLIGGICSVLKDFRDSTSLLPVGS